MKRHQTSAYHQILASLIALVVFAVWFNTRLHNHLSTTNVDFHDRNELPLLAVSKRKGPPTWQTYVIGFNEEKVHGKFWDKNAKTGFFRARNSSSGFNRTKCMDMWKECQWWNNVGTDSIVSNDAKLCAEKWRECQWDKHSGVVWFPAVNGYNQRVLDEFKRGAKPNFPRLTPNISKEKGWFDPKSNRTFPYLSPHVVGCYESHRRLLRLLSEAWGLTNPTDPIATAATAAAHAPDALFVFEDDAICAHNTRQQTMDVVSKLPSTWDMLYLGGNPYMHFEKNVTLSEKDTKAFQEERNNKKITDIHAKPVFRRLACKGAFGPVTTGPMGRTAAGVDDRRALSPGQDYWKITYIFNTHAYVVNPRSIGKILRILDNNVKRNYTAFHPLDQVLSEGMVHKRWAGKIKNPEDRLQVYIPSKGDYCRQNGATDGKKTNFPKEPLSWEGWYIHENFPGFQYVWDEMYWPECQESYEKGLL